MSSWKLCPWISDNINFIIFNS